MLCDAREIECKNVKVMVPLSRALVRPHPEKCAQYWCPFLSKNGNELAIVQRRFTGLVKGIGNLSWSYIIWK